jgi:hypothetical protein
MTAPFVESWTTGTRWTVGLAAFAVCVLTGFVMGALGRTMRAAGGKGIVAFEKAPDADAATAIRTGWGESGREAAMRSLVVDFAFIPAYVTLAVVLAGTSAAVLRTNGLRAWAAFAAACAWAYVLAGALDVVENVLLIVALRADRVPGWAPRIASKAATVKFAIVYGGALPVVTAVVAATAVP